jgi:DNA topoisomerase-1
VTEEVPKPKRASIPKGVDLETVDLKMAVDLLSLPRFVGDHPEGGTIETAIGRFGPYVLWTKPPEEGKKTPQKIYANIKDPAEVFTIGMNRAIEELALKAARGGRGQAAKPLRELGEHPDGGALNVMSGRYGPYVKWEKVNATLPKDMEPDSITIEQAIELVNAKAATKGKGRRKAAPKKKPAAKKTTKKAAPKAKTS